MAEPKVRTMGSPLPEGSKTVTQIDAEHRAFLAAQPITVRCADCLWEHTALPATARLEWAKHRRDTHGDDQIVGIVERSLNAEPRRRPGAGILVGKKTLAENVAGARAVGADGSRVHSDPPAAAKNGDTNEEEHVSEPANPGRLLWTRELAIDSLKAFHAEHGRSPSQFELRAPLPGSSILARLFGSQNAAYEAAGIPVRSKGGRHERRTTGTPARTKTPVKIPEPAPAKAKPERAKGHAAGHEKGSPRSLADIETELIAHDQAINEAREHIALAQADITDHEAAIERLLDEARARIAEMARPFARSAT